MKIKKILMMITWVLCGCDFFSSKRENNALSQKEILESVGVEVYDDYIRTPLGEIFHKIEWKDALHRDIALTLGDPERARELHFAFKQSFAGSDLEVIKNWIIKHCGFLGNSSDFKMMQNDPKLQAVLQNDLVLAQDLERFLQAIRFQKSSQRGREAIKNIAILTTSGGGGHYTTAKALEQELIRKRKYDKVVLIDEFELQKSFDPIYIATNHWTSDLIYEKIFQQENNSVKASRYWKALDALKDYIPWRPLKVRKDVLSEIDPDYIFSTTHHIGAHTFLPYQLGVPLGVVATDYCIHTDMRDHILSISSEFIDYLLPAVDFSIFSSFFDKKNTSHPKLVGMKKYIDGRTSFANLNSDFGGVFRNFGFPVRRSFAKKLEGLEKEQALLHFGLNHKRKVVLLSMGKTGMGVLRDVVINLQATQAKLREKISVVVLCGTNKILKKELEEELFEKQKREDNITFVFKNFLEEEEIAKLYGISDVMLTKPGGASSAEAFVSGLYLLLLFDKNHSWEKGNMQYAIKNGLGEKLESTRSLVPQLNEIFRHNSRRSLFMPTNWENNLTLLLEEREMVKKPIISGVETENAG